MSWLIDTSILGRLANANDLQYSLAAHAVIELHRRGEVLQVTPQVLIEFRNVATRPVAVNGLGLSAADAEALAATFEARFPLLADTPDVFPQWKAIVGKLAVVGKQVHDARLVAVCHAHRVTHLLTFNASHFAKLATVGSGITVVDPASV